MEKKNCELKPNLGEYQKIGANDKRWLIRKLHTCQESNVLCTGWLLQKLIIYKG